MGHRTSKQSMSRKLKETKEWIKRVRSRMEIKAWWPTLRAKLTGHYNYFGVSGNCRGIQRFYYHVVMTVFKWINRRSQRKSMTWDMFQQYLQWNPLPIPRICYALYDAR